MPDRRRRLLLLKKKLIVLQLMRKPQKMKRRWWVRPLWQKRQQESEFFTAMKLMRAGDLDYFKKFYRMTPQEYDYVLKLVEDDLRRSYVCREPISASERLAMTLRYLSSGDPVKDVALAFRVGISTARAAIIDTCKSLWERLRPLYMPKTHSIVLMASADAHYCFTIVDVGAYGRNSDGGVLKNSNFGIAMEKGLLKVPGPKLLPGSNVVAPHVFIGDEAFQLRDDFMRPYPGQNLENAKDNFNQRLSRARNPAESAKAVRELFTTYFLSAPGQLPWKKTQP
ncbi:hypothetical protein ISCGN_000576 [Ixodes scapularis]